MPDPPPIPTWARFWICQHCKRAKMTVREAHCTEDGKRRDTYAKFYKN